MHPARIELYPDGCRRNEPVLLGHLVPRALEQPRHVSIEHVSLLARVADREAPVGDGFVPARDLLFVQVQGVEDPHVERISGEGPLERGDPLRFAARADEVESELGTYLGVLGVGEEGLTHHRDDLLVAMLPLRVLADDLVQTRVPRVLREDCRLGAVEPRSIIGEKADRRTEAQEVQISWIVL